MGCDMHVHQEIKIGDTWHHYAYKKVDRNYELFGLIAGVRDHYEGEPIAPDRGVPKDITALTRINLEYERGDAHSHTWLNAIEIATVEEWLDQKYPQTWRTRLDYFDYLFGNSWGCFTKYPDSEGITKRNITDIRFVIYFDN